MGEKTRKRREEKGKEERLKGKMKEILKVIILHPLCLFFRINK